MWRRGRRAMFHHIHHGLVVTRTIVVCVSNRLCLPQKIPLTSYTHTHGASQRRPSCLTTHYPIYIYVPYRYARPKSPHTTNQHTRRTFSQSHIFKKDVPAFRTYWNRAVFQTKCTPCWSADARLCLVRCVEIAYLG